MRPELRSTRQGIAREGGSVYVQVIVDPRAAATRDGGRDLPRRPVALALVFDRSGSMGGPAGGHDRIWSPERGYRPVASRTDYLPVYGRTKMDYVKAAAHGLIDAAKTGDSMALVSFSNSGRLEAPLTLIDTWNRSLLHEAVACFQPEDSTNLHEGLVVAEKQFPPSLPGTHYCKIILLSDGLANVGVTSPGGIADFALSAHRRGVTVSALGVGLDYSAELMATLAQCGGGHFHHIADAYYLPEVILGELRGAGAILARRVRLEISCAPMVAVSENLNLYHQEPRPGGVAVDIGDLNGTRDLVLEVATPAGFRGDLVPVSATLLWDDLSGASRESTAELVLTAVDASRFETLPVDVALAAEVVRLIEARALRLASGAYDAGDAGRSQASVGTGLADLARMIGGAPELDGPLHAAEARLQDAGARFARREMTASETKELFSQAYESTVGQGKAERGRRRAGK